MSVERRCRRRVPLEPAKVGSPTIFWRLSTRSSKTSKVDERATDERQLHPVSATVVGMRLRSERRRLRRPVGLPTYKCMAPGSTNPPHVLPVAPLAFAALILMGAGSPGAMQGILEAQPTKDLSPPDVIRIQLAALAHNRMLGEDRGIEVTWRFASPANKAMTGPLGRFRTMVKRGYPEMLDHRRSKLGGLELTAVEAKQLVLVQAKDGRVHAYIWVLGLQEDGPYRGCWMTEAVVEVDGVPGETGPDRPKKSQSAALQTP